MNTTLARKHPTRSMLYRGRRAPIEHLVGTYDDVTEIGGDAFTVDGMHSTKQKFRFDAQDYLRCVVVNLVGLLDNHPEAYDLHWMPGGSAVAGDYSLTCTLPCGHRLYLMVVGSRMHFVEASPSGVSLLWRVGRDSTATDGHNNWEPWTISATALALKMVRYHVVLCRH